MVLTVHLSKVLQLCSHVIAGLMTLKTIICFAPRVNLFWMSSRIKGKKKKYFTHVKLTGLAPTQRALGVLGSLIAIRIPACCLK